VFSTRISCMCERSEPKGNMKELYIIFMYLKGNMKELYIIFMYILLELHKVRIY
jgi:hypothetical protein